MSLLRTLLLLGAARKPSLLAPAVPHAAAQDLGFGGQQRPHITLHDFTSIRPSLELHPSDIHLHIFSFLIELTPKLPVHPSFNSAFGAVSPYFSVSW
ncbi:hypothetical protein GUJ93_ZPchr0002g23908 [Zizania palustris]|uniref:Uncharacterized protein n=1 Tax=Zizania palustris TaxID=103762 RepID=A0A8J5VUR9_ZIZPA|nr:hypothetical protein GUJ93_ZPchr0002g23908 [Zizania palustris]